MILRIDTLIKQGKVSLKYLFVLLLFFVTIACKKENNIEPIVFDVQVDLLNKINEIRQKGCICGNDTMPVVASLISNNMLKLTGEGHAIDMFNRNYFNHLSPEGLSAINRARAQHYQGTEVGEIIAKDFFSTDEVIKGWLNSESHCKAIMDSNYAEMGGSRVSNYWVVNFGKP